MTLESRHGIVITEIIARNVPNIQIWRIPSHHRIMISAETCWGKRSQTRLELAPVATALRLCCTCGSDIMQFDCVIIPSAHSRVPSFSLIMSHERIWVPINPSAERRVQLKVYLIHSPDWIVTCKPCRIKKKELKHLAVSQSASPKRRRIVHCALYIWV